jgi:hypothetical protein
MNCSKLKPLEKNEVYIAVADSDEVLLSGYLPSCGTGNRYIVEAIFEPINRNVDKVLVLYAQGNVQRLVPRAWVKKFNVETRGITPAWSRVLSGTKDA